MRLSQRLELDDASGNLGRALEGYSKIAEDLEQRLWVFYYNEACQNGADLDEAREYADKRIPYFSPQPTNKDKG